jgi:hypothetical protein
VFRFNSDKSLRLTKSDHEVGLKLVISMSERPNPKPPTLIFPFKQISACVEIIIFYLKKPKQFLTCTQK